MPVLSDGLLSETYMSQPRSYDPLGEPMTIPETVAQERPCRFHGSLKWRLKSAASVSNFERLDSESCGDKGIRMLECGYVYV